MLANVHCSLKIMYLLDLKTELREICNGGHLTECSDLGWLQLKTG
jgi:hypothetical protein